MPAAQIKVRGQAELERAFMQLRREVLAELRPGLRRIGDVVRADAQERAGREISNIGGDWSRMRVGVTVKSVYVAPASRRKSGTRRPNLAGLLMDRAMQPALDAHGAEAVAMFEELVAVSSRRAGF